MAQLQQTERGDKGQQGTVGHSAGVGHRFGFAAERKGDRLRGLGAGELKRRVPGQDQDPGQQQTEWHAGGQRCIDEG